ncbi:MAG TPA: zeaxanthin glucosyltransferase, partial [Leclercia adecarboxylata]|nr:zeaxanthin glucosyltransferase [Leclercia adecarboxylata]
AVLRDASAVITPAGLNPVMDAIATATPILAVPLAFDQPGVAARVVFSGIGLKACRFSPSRTLSQHLLDLLENKQYTQRITALQTQLINAGGAARAAEIIEQAVCTRRSVPTM